jgi:NAD(P)H-nitrite reductase large subunit
MSLVVDSIDRVICHCLQVKESQIVDAIAVTGAESVRDVIRDTGAGAGCTACHCRIRELLGCRTAAAGSAVEVARD